MTAVEVRWLLTRILFLLRSIEISRDIDAIKSVKAGEVLDNSNVILKRAWTYQCWSAWEIHFRLFLSYRFNEEFRSHGKELEKLSVDEIALFRKSKLSSLIYRGVPQELNDHYDALTGKHFITPF